MEEITDINIRQLIESRIDSLFQNSQLKATIVHVQKLSDNILIWTGHYATMYTVRGFCLVTPDNAIYSVSLDIDSIGMLVKYWNTPRSL